MAGAQRPLSFFAPLFMRLPLFTRYPLFTRFPLFTWYPLFMRFPLFMLSLPSLLDDKCRRLTAAAGGHVEQRGGREAAEAAVDIRAVGGVRCRVDHPIDHVHLAVDEAGIGLAWQGDALLHDGWLR